LIEQESGNNQYFFVFWHDKGWLGKIREDSEMLGPPNPGSPMHTVCDTIHGLLAQGYSLFQLARLHKRRFVWCHH
jgi:hypothetical protein